MFCEKLSAAVEPPEADEMPVICPAPVMLLTTLLETFAAPPKQTTIPIIALVPPVQLVKVLPVTVFVGEPPSLLLQPEIAVAPVTVMFEKLLFLFVTVVPATEEAFVVKTVTVPPAPVLLNPVTMELAFVVCVPPVGSVTLFEMNVTEPVVLTFKLVKVLLLMFWLREAPAFESKVIAPVAAAIVCVVVLKSLLLMFCVVVALTVVLSTIMPCKAPANTPLLTEILLLLMVLTIVPVGAALNAGTKIPRSVPAIVPPFELTTLLYETL